MNVLEQLNYLDQIFSNDGPLAQKFGADYQKRPGQIALAKKWLTAANSSTHLMAEGPTGCHAKGQGILMFDGTVKLVEDIEVGDLLTGPDGQSREVRSLIQNTGKMVEISHPSTDLKPWCVNLDHIITLVHSGTSQIKDISIREWLQDQEDHKEMALWKSSWKMILCAPLFTTSIRENITGIINFDIIPISAQAPYYGFQLTGDGRYLLDNGIVTHNSGKSLSYLIPSALLILDKDDPDVECAVVATANIALQEQIFYKDLPLIKEVLFPELTFGLLKGLGNYVCRQRLTEAQQKLPPDDEDMQAIDGWEPWTETGDKSELDVEIKRWNLFSSTADECLGKKCPDYFQCYGKAAQLKARRSNVVVTNFHMLLVAGFSLPAHQLLICDEGHSLAEVARNALGFKISRKNMNWMVRKLDDLGETKAALALEDAVTEFERYFFDFIGTKKKDKIIDSPQEVPSLTSILQNLTVLQIQLKNEEKEAADEGHEENEAKFARDIKRVENLNTHLTALELCDASSVFWAERITPSFQVRQSKFQKQHKQGMFAGSSPTGNDFLNIQSRPIDVSTTIRDMLFVPRLKKKEAEAEQAKVLEKALAATQAYETPEVDDIPESKQLRKSALLISATMTSNSGFEFMRSETGLTKDLGTDIVVPSPFNLREQGVLVIPETMAPQPAWPVTPETQAYYYDALADHLQEFIVACDGRVMALFTSWTALKQTMDRVATILPNVTVWRQGEAPRTNLVEAFRNKKQGVLAGVDSFWTGVDIPGMQGIFIDKLPFPVPSSPLFAAMCKMYEAQGKKPFFDLSLPLAVLKLRQGMGRLIRRDKDRGYAMIADRRLLDKGYGQSVISALPSFRFTTRMENL